MWLKSNIIDHFMFKVFSISKFLSAIVIAICLLVATSSGLKLLFGGGKSLDVPDFSVVQASMLEKAQSNAEDYSALQKKRGIEKKFGDDISDLIKKYNLPSQAYDIFLSDLLGMDKEYRSKFMDGLDDFLSDAQNYIKKEGDKAKIDIVEASNRYRNMFRAAINEVQVGKIESESNKIYLVGIFAGALLVLLAFIIIPLLIQIEQNTRKE